MADYAMEVRRLAYGVGKSHGRWAPHPNYREWYERVEGLADEAGRDLQADLDQQIAGFNPHTIGPDRWPDLAEVG